MSASDIINPKPSISSLQKVIQLTPKNSNNEWCVFAYILNRDMIKSDGTLDELHGLICLLGSFNDKNKAETHAKKIIEKTGYNFVTVSKYAKPVPLSITPNSKTIVDVPVDIRGKIVNLESEQFKRETEEYDRRSQIERDMVKEAEDETNPESEEYFKRKCYLAIKNKSAYLYHKRQMEEVEQNYKKYQSEIREHYKKYPEHEATWLVNFKEKLMKRNESELYNSVEKAYKEIRGELLNISEN